MEREDLAAATPVDTEASRGLTELLAARYSCRAYRPDPVPRAVIERMLAIAQLSASWCNVQPWQTIVISPPETEAFRTALMAYVADKDAPAESDIPYPAAYTGAYLERRRECGWQLYDAVGVKQGDRAGSAAQANENFRLFGAPHVLILTSERDLGPYGAVDCGLYLGNLMNAAQSLGLATIAQAALARCTPFLRRRLQIPEHRMVVCGMSFGYADAGHPANAFRTRRAGLAESAVFHGRGV